MKPIDQSQPAYYRWLFPAILFAGVILLAVLVVSVIGIRTALATQRDIAKATTEAIDVVHVTPMAKWEYKVIGAETMALSVAGAAGWELVSVDSGIAYFKRPLRAAMAAEKPMGVKP